jgi:hypothetical protein
VAVRFSRTISVGFIRTATRANFAGAGRDAALVISPVEGWPLDPLVALTPPLGSEGVSVFAYEAKHEAFDEPCVFARIRHISALL